MDKQQLNQKWASLSLAEKKKLMMGSLMQQKLKESREVRQREQEAEELRSVLEARAAALAHLKARENLDKPNE
jgi:hypothetical protein